jgi:hypothetical protein
MFERQDDCNFCNEGLLELGQCSEYPAMVVLKTGNNPYVDWYATLQSKTMTDPAIGLNIMLMPVGHLEYFYQTGGLADENAKGGIATARLRKAMHIVMEEEWETRGETGIFFPPEIEYGKQSEGRNTQPHIHTRFTDTSGGLAQPYPSDTGWRKKQTYTAPDDDEEAGRVYVRADPSVSKPLSEERFNRVGKRLVKLCRF